MIGILLTNLGTPDAPTTAAVRRYLAEFLADRRVVEIPKLAWWPILHGLVLRLRPRRSAKLYQKIWTAKGSPLLIHSQQLAQNLQLALTLSSAKPVTVALGMRYGNPSISQAFAKFQQKNIQQLIVLPLYPQYAAATTGSTFDAVTNILKSWRFVPKFHFIQEYYTEPKYISALTAHIRTQLQHCKPNAHIVFSFHGLPKRNASLGDPYQQQCEATAQKLANKLQLPGKNWSLAFQSRFGRAEWLQPYCDQTLQRLAKRGKKNVVVVCPGFAVDCLETLEEIALQYRDVFLQAGGKHFHYIPALNASDAHVEMLMALVKKHLR